MLVFRAQRARFEPARTERSNDHDTILATVSPWDSSVIRAGAAARGEFESEFSSSLAPEAVDGFYASSLRRPDTLEQFPMNEVNAPRFYLADLDVGTSEERTVAAA
jgi:hypothetical protein